MLVKSARLIYGFDNEARRIAPPRYATRRDASPRIASQRNEYALLIFMTAPRMARRHGSMTRRRIARQHFAPRGKSGLYAAPLGSATQCNVFVLLSFDFSEATQRHTWQRFAPLRGSERRAALLRSASQHNATVLLMAPNAFEQASEIETLAKREIMPWLRGVCDSVEATDFSSFLQKIWGDFVATKRGRTYSIELKAEWKARENFFLEMFSNMKWGTPGWMLTSQANLLFYFFGESRILYVMSLSRLREWAFSVDAQGRQTLDRYPLKRQNKYDQQNDSWGRCTPIQDVLAGIDVRVIGEAERAKQLAEVNASDIQW